MIGFNIFLSCFLEFWWLEFCPLEPCSSSSSSFSVWVELLRCVAIQSEQNIVSPGCLQEGSERECEPCVWSQPWVNVSHLQAIWENQFYYLFGFLFLVFIILVVSCSQISIVMVYFQLCAEVISFVFFPLYWICQKIVQYLAQFKSHLL